MLEGLPTGASKGSMRKSCSGERDPLVLVQEREKIRQKKKRDRNRENEKEGRKLEQKGREGERKLRG